MGWACSWIGVRTSDASAVIEALGMQRTGERADDPDARWSTAALTSGWSVLFCAAGCEPPAFADASLAAISADRELIHCSVEEHVMYAASSYWKRGSMVWRVVHDAQEGMYDLDASGDLPPGFAELRAKHIDAQNDEGGDEADVDMVFEIPLEMAVQVCGFRHDEDYAVATDGAFETLAVLASEKDSPKPAKRWWRW